MTTTVTITREIEITVEVEYISGSRATHLNPQEFSRVRILDAFDELDQGVRLTEAECDEVREMVLNSPPERDYDERDDF